MMKNSIKATHTHLTTTNLAPAGLAITRVAATAALPFVEEFETIPENSENVPNVALFAPTQILLSIRKISSSKPQISSSF